MHKNVKTTFNSSHNCIYNLNVVNIKSLVSILNCSEIGIKTHVCEKSNNEKYMTKSISSGLRTCLQNSLRFYFMLYFKHFKDKKIQRVPDKNLSFGLYYIQNKECLYGKECKNSDYGSNQDEYKGKETRDVYFKL